jgi:L-lactate utilization protein LutB
MADFKEKKGLVGRFIEILSGKPAEDKTKTKVKAHSKALIIDDDEGFDLGFVKRFTHSGGKFLYCDDENEAYTYIRLIMEESGLGKVYCKNENLISILRKADVEISEDLKSTDAFCSEAEYLVASNGGIMLSANQLKGKTLEELPETFITIAKTSQITDKLRTALTGIRVKYQNNLPSQITTIKGPIKFDDIEEADIGKICNKEIYLLLLEDQL